MVKVTRPSGSLQIRSFRSCRSASKNLAKTPVPSCLHSSLISPHCKTGLTSRRFSAAASRFQSPSQPSSSDSGDRVSAVERLYVNFTGFPFPLGPLLQRKTIRYEVTPGQMWTFEQEQSLGFSNVTTNVRMTVIKLSSGGLWIHAPIAPTRECIRLVKELGAPVEHVVLPTFAYEHKVFMGPFCRRFPNAQRWVAPGQWSWPVNLPPSLLGIRRPKVIGRDDAPWANDIDFEVLCPPSLGLADYVGFPEVAFFHARTRTLLVTDSVILVPDNPPDVVRKENLLDAATDNAIVRLSMKLVSGVDISGYDLVREVDDTPEARRRGWRRMALQVLFFGPENIYDPTESFDAIRNRLVVSPILRRLVFNKVPVAVRDWVEAICSKWDFKRVIPCHFAGPVPASPRDFRKAFDWLEAESADYLPEERGETRAGLPALFGALFRRSPGTTGAFFRFPEQDLKLLNGLNRLLFDAGVFKPPLRQSK